MTVYDRPGNALAAKAASGTRVVPRHRGFDRLEGEAVSVPRRQSDGRLGGWPESTRSGPSRLDPNGGDWPGADSLLSDDHSWKQTLAGMPRAPNPRIVAFPLDKRPLQPRRQCRRSTLANIVSNLAGAVKLASNCGETQENKFEGQQPGARGCTTNQSFDLDWWSCRSHFLQFGKKGETPPPSGGTDLITP